VSVSLSLSVSVPWNLSFSGHCNAEWTGGGQTKQNHPRSRIESNRLRYRIITNPLRHRAWPPPYTYRGGSKGAPSQRSGPHCPPDEIFDKCIWTNWMKNKKHLKNVGPFRHCEPPHAHSPGIATVARRTPPAHRCPRRRRRQRQRQRVHDRGDRYGPMKWAQSVTVC